MTQSPITDSPITDSHCHLDFPDFDGERDAVIARALAAGVTRMVTICTKLHNEPAVRAIAETYPSVFYAAGVHPMSAAEHPAVTVDDLVALAQHPKFVGIGETGLDYHYTADSKAIQQSSLRIHIAAARATGLPLIIHARDADDDMARILAEEYRNGAYTCVMHCFSSSAALGKVALDLGFYLSMSGIAAFPKSQQLRDIFASVPLDSVLLETDSPYLAPPPHRGRRNEPAYTAHTAAVGAELYGLDYAAFAAATNANFDRLFWKAAA
ncbi:MAG: TatD family hydrolase [Proteobacteria bacterium]|nr:TatD family hydrolase [Pseudomonadota bacterium]MDA1155541.1 TatD family hydrolase [Pseudomonadota bacterium]